ncbi:ribonuclease P protein component [Patescibacteria group bacterium]
MIAKPYKFTSQDYKKVLKSGKKIKLGWAGIVYTPSQNNKPLYGLIVPVSSIAKATQRNQVKRKIYSIIQEIIKKNSKQKHKIVVRVFKEPKESDYQKLDKTIQGLAC